MNAESAAVNVQGENGKPGKPWWKRRWFKITVSVVGVALLALLLAGEYVLHHLSPIVHKKVVEALSKHFHAPVQLDRLEISLLRGVEVDGGGLRIPYEGPVDPGVPGKPHTLIEVQSFHFRSSWSALLRPETHLDVIYLSGLTVDLPPGDEKKRAFGDRPGEDGGASGKDQGKPSAPAFVVDEVRCENVRLIIENSHPEKEPKEWDIDHLVMNHFSPDQAMEYEANLTNPIPKGEIHSTGHFGPWNVDDPRSTSLDGEYTFRNADMNTIKGIGGTLNSVGSFNGVLDHIVVDGETDTPNFSLDISDHPVPLHTKFHAFVDGTTGDTDLEPVDALLGRTHIVCRGTVVNLKGKGHDTWLDAVILNGRMEDVLELGMKSPKPMMVGSLNMKAKIHVPPGKVRVAEKLELNGTVDVQHVIFTNPMVQDKMDGLSMRAQGKMHEMATAASNGRPDVESHITSLFNLKSGKMSMENVVFEMPGAHIRMAGVYEMNGSVYDFKGMVRTDATASQMVTGWKSLMLKPVDPFLQKNGAGVQLPIEIMGVKSDMHFNLAFKHGEDSADQIQKDLEQKRAAGAINLHPKPKSADDKAKQKQKDVENYQKMKAQAAEDRAGKSGSLSTGASKQ
ncbi:MAG: hypothetical protein PW735_02630 [Acidobacteriaceae bacterium]|nr:hypothetical protein [Acidobacteriaceae bacterium]